MRRAVIPEVVARTGDRTQKGRHPKMSAFRITRRYLGFDTVKTSSGRRIRIGDRRVMALVVGGSLKVQCLAGKMAGRNCSAQMIPRNRQACREYSLRLETLKNALEQPVRPERVAAAPRQPSKLAVP